VRLIDVDVEPKSLSPGSQAHLSVLVDFAEPVNRGEFIPTAQMIGPMGPVALPLFDVTTENERAAQRLKFSATITAPSEEGAWRVDVTFPGQGTHATYFETWRQR